MYMIRCGGVNLVSLYNSCWQQSINYLMYFLHTSPYFTPEYLFILFIYLNTFIQDIKHNSASLLYVVMYNKIMWVQKKLFPIPSFNTIMCGSIFKVSSQTVPWNCTLVYNWISE